MIGAERLSSLESILAGDHDRLEQAFNAIVTRVQGGDYQEMEAAWLQFQGALLQHLEAEEKYMIPALAQDRPRAAEALLDDHARIRAMLIELGIELDLHHLGAAQIEAFVAALRAHARREETTFYPWIDSRLA